MAIILKLAREQYIEGGVRLFRGDAWNIDAQVVNRVGTVDLDKDLTGGTLTAYFPKDAASGGTVSAAATIIDAACGKIRIPVDEDTTPLIQTAVNGIQLYVLMDGIPASGYLTTAQMLEPDLQILDREFFQT